MNSELLTPAQHRLAATGNLSLAPVDDDTQAAPVYEAELSQPATAVPARSAKPVPGILETLLWALAMLTVMSVPGVVAILFLPPQDWTGITAMVIMLSGQVCSVALGLLAVRLRLGRDWPRLLNLRLPRLLPCLLAVLCVPGWMVLHATAGLLTAFLSGTPHAGQMVADAGMAAPFWLALLTIAVGAALNEELWCRGFFAHGLVGRYGVLLGLLLTALVFGLIHLNLPQSVGAFVLGIGLHLAYLATRSLWVPVLLHFMNNGIAVLVMFSPATSIVMEPTEMELVSTLVFALGTLIVLGVAGYSLYKVRVRPEAA